MLRCTLYNIDDVIIVLLRYATLPAHAPNPSDYADYPWIASFPAEPDTGVTFGWRPKACIRHTLGAMGTGSRMLASLSLLGNQSSTTTNNSRHHHSHHSGADADADALVGATFESFVAASMSVEMESAWHALSSAIEALKSAESCRSSLPCQQAIAVLDAWDSTCAPDSKGSLLWDRFRADFVTLGGSNWVTDFALNDPINT